MELAAAVVGVIDIVTRTSSGVWSLCDQWNDAPRELHLLRNDLTRASQLFGEVENSFADWKDKYARLRRSRPDSVRALLAVLRYGNTIITELKTSIDRLLRQGQPPGQTRAASQLVVAKRRKLEWLAKRSRILKNQKALVDVMGEVCLFLTSLNMTATTDLTSELQDVNDRLHDVVHSTAQDTRHYIDIALRTAASHVVSEMAIGLSNVYSSPVPGEFSGQRQAPSKSGHQLAAIQDPYSAFTGSASAQYALGCDCKCHKFRNSGAWKITSPNRMLGALQISYRGYSAPWVSGAGLCTNTQCQHGHKPNWIRLEYHLPDWLLRIALCAFFTGSPTRPEVLIRVTHRIPQTQRGSVFELCVTGDLEGVKRALRDKKCSVHDLWAPLNVNPVFIAVQWEKVSIAKLLLQAGSDPLGPGSADPGWDSAIHAAFRKVLSGRPGTQIWGELFDLSGLVEQLEYPDLSRIICGFLPLDSALAVRNPEFRHQIQQPGTDGLMPIHLAAIRGDSPAIAALLEAGVSPEIKTSNATPTTPLTLACYFGRPSTAKVLLDGGASVNQTFGADSQSTPLHVVPAVRDEPAAFALVSLLIEHGADVNALSLRDNATPLFGFVQRDLSSCTEILLSKGANLNALDHLGAPALYDGIEMRAHKAVAVLLAHGADYRMVTFSGWGVLHMLARSGDVEILRLFLLHRMTELDREARDKLGKTPTDLFEERQDITGELRREFKALLDSLREDGVPVLHGEDMPWVVEEDISDDEFHDAAES